MLLTVSLSGWHKEVVNYSECPPLAVVSKGPRSVQLRGPFALPGLRHDILLLLGKCGLEGMGDGFLTGLEATVLDGFVDCSPEKSWDPDVHLSVSPFPARFAKALNALDLLSIRHGIHLLHSCHIERCPIPPTLWSRLARIHS